MLHLLVKALLILYPVLLIARPVSAEDVMRPSAFRMAGQEVAVLLRGWRRSGHYALAWDGRDGAGRPLASGTYFYALQAGGQTEKRKLTLVH